MSMKFNVKFTKIMTYAQLPILVPNLDFVGNIPVPKIINKGYNVMKIYSKSMTLGHKMNITVYPVKNCGHF